jgi:hypothetical protein
MSADLRTALARLVEAVTPLLESISQMHTVEMAPDGPDNCAGVCVDAALVRGALDGVQRALATPLGADWRERARQVLGHQPFHDPAAWCGACDDTAAALADAYAAGVREERDRCAALAETKAPRP